MKINTVENAILSETEFRESFPNMALPVPLTEAVLDELGAVWVEDPEEGEALRTELLARVNAWRDAQEQMQIVFVHDGRNWDGGFKPRSRLSPSVEVAQAGLLPSGFYWTDADNNDVPMTSGALIALDAAMLSAMVTKGWAIHQRQRAMKQEIADLETEQEILGYAVGWSE